PTQRPRRQHRALRPPLRGRYAGFPRSTLRGVSGMTRLPLALAPLQDEAWPSYLTRQAAQHGTTLAGMGSHLGLRDARGRWPGRFGVTMAETEAARVAPMLSLAPKQVQRMQLAAYHQLAFDLGGLAHNSAIGGTRATVHAAW